MDRKALIIYISGAVVSITAIIFIIASYFYKKTFTKFILISISFIFVGVFLHLCLTLWYSLVPLYECHFRTVVCWALPLIFMTLAIFNREKFNTAKYTNLICIVLICGIFQTTWQIVNTYYWHKNITFIKTQIAESKDTLFIPDAEKALSSYFDGRFYRYIWHNTYPALSILLSPEYEQKTLLTFYKTEKVPVVNFYEKDLYKFENYLSVPALQHHNYIDIKNKYWDLTKCAEEVDKYNKQSKNLKKLEKLKSHLISFVNFY